MRKNLVLNVLWLTLILSGGLFAGPITFTEGADLPGTGGPTLTLGIGQNTISGAVSGCPGCGGDFQDNFVIALPAGMVITGGGLSLSYTNNGGGAVTMACYTSFGCFGTGAFSGLGSNFITPGGSLDFTASSPYTTPSVQVAGSSSYTLTINVDASVPEPSTALMVMPVVAGLAFAVRRRGRRAQ